MIETNNSPQKGFDTMIMYMMMFNSKLKEQSNVSCPTDTVSVEAFLSNVSHSEQCFTLLAIFPQLLPFGGHTFCNNYLKPFDISASCKLLKECRTV